jgi:hypothetical protein
MTAGYAQAMTNTIDAMWRAAAYCFRPSVLVLSLIPLFLAIGLTVGLGFFFWDAALEQVRVWLDASALVNSAWKWLDSTGAGKLKTVLAPLIVIFSVTPLIVLLTLILVSVCVSPLLVNLVARRRFAGLERREGAGLVASIAWAAGSCAMALLALLVSTPLWLVPSVVLVIPPFIWGWLTYRVMAFDALASHATREERRELFARHRLPLLGMGILVGFMGAGPGLVWASGVMFAVGFVLLVPLAIWVYTAVFVFSSLWFTHFCLTALSDLRREGSLAQAPGAVLEPVLPVMLSESAAQQVS